MNEHRQLLEEIVHDSLYENKDSDREKKLKTISEYLNQNNDFFQNLRSLIMGRNNENYLTYDTLIEYFFKKSNKEYIKILLNQQEQYKDILKNEKIYVNLWNVLDTDEQIAYLKNKKRYTELDILLINSSLQVGNNFNENSILDLILNDQEVHDRIDSFTITLNYSYPLLCKLNLNDYDKCRLLTRKTYSLFLLKKCKNFNEFIELYNGNKKIFNLIDANILSFPTNDYQNIYEFILKNPKFIGKFEIKYTDLFSIVEINDMFNDKSIDSDAYSTLIQKIYKYDKEKANSLFSEDSLKKCSKHSLTINPFPYLDEDTREIIFNDYSLFNRFIDTIMVEVIGTYFKEEDIITLLRNDTFVNDTSSYAMELLLNSLSFKSVFNMLQRKNILDKINNLNVTVLDNDAIFVKGFLDSPSLILKTDHTLLYVMLMILSGEDALYYLCLPYIYEALTSYEIINIAIHKDILIHTIIDSKNLLNRLNTTEIINYIDNYFEKHLDLSIFFNEDLVKKLFNLSDKQIKEIDFNEVNYLYETIRMKSVLSKQLTTCDVQSYRSILISYLLFGLEGTLNIINTGNEKVSLKDVLELQQKVVSERILDFKRKNSSIFQNITKKITENLLSIPRLYDKLEFAKSVRGNTYLDNIMFLMLDNNFDSYNNIIEKFYEYRTYKNNNRYAINKEMYDYATNFVRLYLDNKAKVYNTEFNNIILKNFKLKENVLYAKRKEVGKEFINHSKFKLFVKALSETNKDKYKELFKDDYPLNKIKNKYITYLGYEELEFDNLLNHVLIPYTNERFDKQNCLSHLGIQLPDNYIEYYKYVDDLQVVTNLNEEIEKLKENYNQEEILSIMNYICYGNNINFKIKGKDKKKINKLMEPIASLGGEIYVDKSTRRFLYKDNIDIYNIEEIIEYHNYMEILDDIITRTKNYINRHMDSNEVQNRLAKEYFEVMSVNDYVFPIQSKYYEPKKRVFSLNDINKLFKGYPVNEAHPIESDLKEFLLDKNNLVMIADGYYDGIVDNVGLIIYRWNELMKYVRDFDMNYNDIDLFALEDILSLISFEDNIIGKTINKDVIKSITDNVFYEELDINKRIESLIDLYKKTYKCISSSIPYITYQDGDYKVSILDRYNQDILKPIAESLYRVGAIGNDFLHYAILDKNGINVGIYKNGLLVAKLLGVRNGNTVYLNILESVISDNNYEYLIKNFANMLINETCNDVEPIEYVTIVNNEYFNDINSLKVDQTFCPVINYPINTLFIDYENFVNDVNLLGDGEILYTNYADNIATLAANGNIVDKNNFKCYDADSKYLRKRNAVIKLSNNIGEEYLNKIDSILYLCKEEDKDISIEHIALNDVKTIYLGDDFVLFINNKNNISKFVLPYDKRALIEIDCILESLN